MANLPLLLQLQTIDTRLQALNRMRDETQQHPNLSALQMLTMELDTEQRTKTTQQANGRISLRRLELDLKTCQERLRTEEERLYGGTISNSRELEIIQQKSAELRNSRAELEEQILNRMETDEQLTLELEMNQKRLAAALQDANGYRKEIEHRLMEITIEAEGLEQESQELLARIPGEWLERYRKIAKSHAGLAIAKMKTSRCGACHVEVSDALLQKAKRGDDALIYCENCGRILFY